MQRNAYLLNVSAENRQEDINDIHLIPEVLGKNPLKPQRSRNEVKRASTLNKKKKKSKKKIKKKEKKGRKNVARNIALYF